MTQFNSLLMERLHDIAMIVIGGKGYLEIRMSSETQYEMAKMPITMLRGGIDTQTTYTDRPASFSSGELHSRGLKDIMVDAYNVKSTNYRGNSDPAICYYGKLIHDNASGSLT